MQQRKSYRTAAARHNAAVDEIERANEAVARVNRQIRNVLARRHRARVQHQIMQGRRRIQWRNYATPSAVILQSKTTIQQAVSSPISQPEPATLASRKPTRRR